MDSNTEEALRAISTAEKHFLQKDFVTAKNYGLKAQMLCPELDGLPQMVATFGVYIASQITLNGEMDYYSILGITPMEDESRIKRQYKRMSVLLDPNTNKTVGADVAFRLVSEAYTLLSDKHKKASYDKSRASSHDSIDSFWTSCTSCRVQYEYHRKYINKQLSCKNCRGVFIAAEAASAPVVSFQGSSSANSLAVLDPNTLSKSSFVFNRANGEGKKGKSNGKRQAVDATVSNSKVGRLAKKRKLDLAGSSTNGHKEIVSAEAKVAHGNGNSKPVFKLSNPPAPLFDTRQFLINKARTEIRKKLEEMRLASEAEARNLPEASEVLNSELKRTVLTSISVPDSDFHDFDSDRSEDCFKPKQIWALYDEEDGMPRLYSLIREVISLDPFKIHISYLSSKTDTEFGSVNWLTSGFTKSCGSFRVFHSEMVDKVNIFSHLLGREKAGRGGMVRIYPRGGDIWAVYKNWSPDWNRSTLKEVRHQYEMVEVLEDYKEDHGVTVNPLVKVDGYNTVYRRNEDKGTIRYISRREMLRFSHQVPSLNLEDNTELPEGCWDLDPAATPDALLQEQNETKKRNESLNEQFESEGISQSGDIASTSDMVNSVDELSQTETAKF